MKSYETKDRNTHAVQEDREKAQDLSEFSIKLYHSQTILEKAMNTLQKTGLAHQIFSIEETKGGRIPSKMLRRLNELRDDPENQYLFVLARYRLIQDGLMPVDETGRPYDLSLMHIPDLDIAAFTEKITKENKELRYKIQTYYNMYRANYDTEDPDDFLHCLNQMKQDLPDTFVQLHTYLTRNGFIESPMLAELNLTPEQLEFLIHLDTFAVRRAFRTINNKLSTEDEEWDIREQDSEWIKMQAPEINKALALGRLGGLANETAYYEFCIAISEYTRLCNAIVAEKPSYPERAKSMFERAEAKQARATLESKL